ncbi:MAG: aspartate--tRNA ligase, partial [Erysipelotrichaceae bacterium]|nr:aspartate--tRNA ligase [Erysipelotrichaceae bacterium]
MLRSIENGKLRKDHIGQEVELIGWVAKKRNFGQLVFIDLRDRTGLCQLVFDEGFTAKTKEIKNEYILHIKGNVAARKDVNPDLETGDIEVHVQDLEIINEAKTTPLIIANQTDALEDTRLQYRYLDLRRPIMQKKFMMRHQITRSMRQYLDEHAFIEVETPMLGKSTPEGARDYLVPSRVHPGSFYALPQSPQLYKQLLMISGFERYYQFARCFRDEDLRADRQTDFTQVDIETSFLNEEEIQTMMEEMMQKVMKEVKGIDVSIPFKRLTYQQAMDTYGSDKPDDRFDMTLTDCTNVFDQTEFKVFQSVIETKGCIKGFVVHDFSHITRKNIDAFTEIAKKNGAKGLVVLKYDGNEMSGPARKFLSDKEVEQ